MDIKIEFKKQDCWIGAYWDDDNIWICLIPCFPIHIRKGKFPHAGMVCFYCINSLHGKCSDDFCECMEGTCGEIGGP